jgi:hypothetical protein
MVLSRFLVVMGRNNDWTLDEDTRWEQQRLK